MPQDFRVHSGSAIVFPPPPPPSERFYEQQHLAIAALVHALRRTGTYHTTYDLYGGSGLAIGWKSEIHVHVRTRTSSSYLERVSLLTRLSHQKCQRWLQNRYIDLLSDMYQIILAAGRAVCLLGVDTASHASLRMLSACLLSSVLCSLLSESSYTE